MQQLAWYVAHYGLLFVFLNVLLEQLGLPIPAIPTLIVAGALVAQGKLSMLYLLAVALVASMLADAIWYAAGRRHGRRVLKTLCRISLSPDSCVRQTESLFARWGMPSLLLAKFIPGFSTVAPPLAGALRAGLASFLLYDGVGTLLWVGAAIGAGMIFHDAIERIVAYLAGLSVWALVIIGAALFLFIAFKWWERQRFLKALRMARISVDELYRLMSNEQKPIVLDVRTQAAQKLDPRRIPGAILLNASELDQKLAQLPPDREIILYCT